MHVLRFSIIKIPIILDKKNQFWSVIFFNILCIALQLVSFVNNFRSWDSHRKLFFKFHSTLHAFVQEIW